MIITVITATYCNFERIEETICSVLDQTYEEIEYIITDDGSDNFNEATLRDIVEKNKRDNLIDYKIIHHKQNIGTVKNINNAYNEASGDLLVPLSSDDVFYSKNVLCEIAERYQRVGFKAMVTSRLVCGCGDERPYLLPHFNERKRISRLTRNRQYDLFIGKRFFDVASGSCLVLDSQFFKSFGGFDTRYRLYEDAPFFARYLEDYELDVASSIIGIKYNMGGISTNNSINPILLNDMEQYCQTDRIANIKRLSLLSRRIVLYDLETIQNKIQKNSKNNMYKAKYLDIIIYRKVERGVRNTMKIIDRLHIV